MARLKVFKAHMGFFDSVVAAPSQKAALEAWGTRQNLFGEGLAAPTEEPEAVKAALAEPGVVLRRAAGSSGAYAKNAAAPDAPRAPSPAKAQVKGHRAQAPAPRPTPDRSGLTAAEAALKGAEAAHAHEMQGIERERRALESRARELEDRFKAERRGLEKAVDKARRAYERAGG